MPQTLQHRPVDLAAERVAGLVAPPAAADSRRQPEAAEPASRGFGKASGKATGKGSGKGRKRRGTGLTAADRGPLGRSPDLEAIQARHRLGLALAGRLSPLAVNRAWKQAAAEHHPDRGGHHGTMQAINAARDLLLAG
ncbi:molecular chaperone DnaJ [Synechococcus sp. GreenBA-s]|jgi:hypothetical protein|nr:molecular chaperone DnaJ [Synechococcus sp. GreenBA-s]